MVYQKSFELMYSILFRIVNMILSLINYILINFDLIRFLQFWNNIDILILGEF